MSFLTHAAMVLQAAAMEGMVMSEHSAGSSGQSAGYPLNDTVCRLISLIHKKSQSLCAYESGPDGSSSQEMNDLLARMREADEVAVKELANKLRNELNKQFCESSPETGETDPLINCTSPLPKEEAIAKVENLKDEQLVDESEAMESVKQSAE